MKAQVIENSKAKLQKIKLHISREGLSPMLFMEWVAERTNEQSIVKIDKFEFHFEIYFTCIFTREDYENCARYINANLPHEEKLW